MSWMNTTLLHWVLGIVLLPAFSVASASIAEASDPRPSASAEAPAVEGDFLGVGSCASTVCHGSVVHRGGSNVAQNEYLVWSERDRHRKAFETLRSDRSRSIATKLGLGDPTQANLCLDCHATNAPRSKRQEKFELTDGVQCESCHGPAGGWIHSHDDRESSHTESVARGMLDLAEPSARASVCLSCHLGKGEVFVSHQIMAAGHPRTDFELDTFTFLQPAHFVLDEDYVARKQGYDSARSWAAGQAASVRRSLEVLTSKSRPGAWPEFALYDCFDCHHDIGSRPGGGAGQGAALGYPGIDRSNWNLYLAVLKTVAPQHAASLGRALRSLDGLAREGSPLGTRASAILAEVVNANQSLDTWRPNEASIRQTLLNLSDASTVSGIRTYSDAEQATMAVQALAAALAERAGRRVDPSVMIPGLEGLFDLTQREQGFDAAAFRHALARIAQTP